MKDIATLAVTAWRPVAAGLLWAGMLGLAAPAPLSAETSGTCCATGEPDRAALLAIRDSGFVAPDRMSSDALAMRLSQCLTSADPVLRDEIGYAGLASLLRNQRLSVAMQRTLLEQQSAKVRGAEAGGGFEKPFAILVLSEVARADRIEPFMTEAERRALVQTGSEYLAALRDYRGFDEQTGWRHGVAHASDLMMQLAMNPAVDVTQLEMMMDAVFAQVSAAPGHFYIYGEPSRLARPVLFAANRGLIEEAKWAALFARIANPAPFASRDAMFASQPGLAKLHNTRLFANALAAALLDKESPNLLTLKVHVKQLRGDLGLL
tara:strand:- start:13454 stop:14416 length:963 start_codon:yes stop_codon:yes gene_type:complete